jgi:hypothetical protein
MYSYINDRIMNIEQHQVSLSTETVQSAARALQSVDDVESGDSLTLSVLSVCYRVTDDLHGRRQLTERQENMRNNAHSRGRS